MKLLLTSGGLTNPSIRKALVGLLGKPVSEADVLCIPTAEYGHPACTPASVWRFIAGQRDAGWRSVGVLELTALPSVGEERWVPWVRGADVLLVDGGDATYLCHEMMPDNTMAEAERWAAEIGGPAYAVDDQTAIMVDDGRVEVVSEGQWRRFPLSGLGSDLRSRTHARSGVPIASDLPVAVRGVGESGPQGPPRQKERLMAEYLLYFNQQWVGDHTDEWFRGRGPLAMAVVNEMKEAGVYVFAGGLEEEDGPVYHADPTSGSMVVIDGPYVETKEFLGGFAIVSVADDEEAKMWAAKVAQACGWTHEVRRFKPQPRTA